MDRQVSPRLVDRHDLKGIDVDVPGQVDREVRAQAVPKPDVAPVIRMVFAMVFLLAKRLWRG